MRMPIAILFTLSMLVGLPAHAQTESEAKANASASTATSQPAAGDPSMPGGGNVGSGPAVVGNAERGRLIFATCRTCHYPEKSVGHNNGPSLWNIFNLQVGSQLGFDYSPALRNAEFVWTPELLDLWLQDTRKFLPGNMMMSPGEPDPQRRADLIEYLKQVSSPSPEGP